MEKVYLTEERFYSWTCPSCASDNTVENIPDVVYCDSCDTEFEVEFD